MDIAFCCAGLIVAQSCPALCDPMDFSLPRSSVHGDSPGKDTGKDIFSPGDLPNLGIELGSPALQVDSLPSELPGKPGYCFIIVLIICNHFMNMIPANNSKINQPYIFIGRTDAEAEVQYFGHRMQRANILEQTLMLGKIEVRRRRG